MIYILRRYVKTKNTWTLWESETIKLNTHPKKSTWYYVDDESNLKCKDVLIRERV